MQQHNLPVELKGMNSCGSREGRCFRESRQRFQTFQRSQTDEILKSSRILGNFDKGIQRSQRSQTFHGRALRIPKSVAYLLTCQPISNKPRSPGLPGPPRSHSAWKPIPRARRRPTGATQEIATYQRTRRRRVGLSSCPSNVIRLSRTKARIASYPPESGMPNPESKIRRLTPSGSP